MSSRLAALYVPATMNELISNEEENNVVEKKRAPTTNRNSFDCPPKANEATGMSSSYADDPFFATQKGPHMSSPRFIKFIPSEEANWLRKNHPNAFLLLSLIAQQARRYEGSGLEIGEAYIGDYKEAGIETEKKYRNAKKILEARGHIKICETNRTRKKSTDGATTIGTKVKILTTSVWDVNFDEGDRRATGGQKKGDRMGDRNDDPKGDRNDDRFTEEKSIENDDPKGDRNDDPKGDRMGVRRATGGQKKGDEQEYKKERKKEENIQKKKAADAVDPLAAKLLAEFFDSLLKSLPEFIPPEKHSKAQIKAMDFLLKKFGETRVRNVFQYAHESDFWMKYVHTPVYLKTKFATLGAQMDSVERGPKEVVSAFAKKISENKDVATKAKDMFSSADYEMNIGDEQIVILSVSGYQVWSLNFKENGFKDQLKNELIKRKFKKR
jgi:hypothetical protein